MEGAVDACGLQVGVIHTIGGIANGDLCPHGAVVGHLEGDVLRGLDGIAAVDDHIVVATNEVGEVFLVRVGVLLVTSAVVVLLEADDIYFLTLHLGKDILCHEARGFTIEHGHVVRGYLETWCLLGILIERTELVHCAGIGNAAEQGDEWHEHPVETTHHEPINEKECIADNQKWQGIDQHGACRVACRLNIAAKKSYKGKHHQQEGGNKHHEREIFLNC